MNKRLFSFLVICNLILGVGQLGISFYRSTDGVKLYEMEKNILAVQQENLRMKEQIYQKMAITNINEQATGLNLYAQAHPRN